MACRSIRIIDGTPRQTVSNRRCKSSHADEDGDAAADAVLDTEDDDDDCIGDDAEVISDSILSCYLLE